MTGPEIHAYCGADHRRWAEVFCQHAAPALDPAIVETWFANAMMAKVDSLRLDEGDSGL